MKEMGHEEDMASGGFWVAGKPLKVPIRVTLEEQIVRIPVRLGWQRQKPDQLGLLAV
eukprot:CAMPEP_0194556244 /NCGR_PEP_ID=MMETSP0253-20130528/98647_1 /TAXON_ID=2966 /ORGANISM="Noctiluca scintillans" /LENGTH=56 /DNA_ID=CAMNT_0039403747 /DNA_START=730 /DNA_END=900 /DNA_ORIENTATION=+